MSGRHGFRDDNQVCIRARQVVVGLDNSWRSDGNSYPAIVPVHHLSDYLRVHEWALNPVLLLESRIRKSRRRLKVKAGSDLSELTSRLQTLKSRVGAWMSI